MNSSGLNNWLQIGANIGLLAGIALVAVQINQNTKLVRIQLLNEESRTLIEGEHSMLGENPAVVIEKSVVDPQNLSVGEMRVMEAVHWRVFQQIQHLYDERELYGEKWKRLVEQEAAWALGTPFGRAWWEENRNEDEVSEYVDEVIAEVEFDSKVKYYSRIKAHLPKFMRAEESP